MPLSLTPIDAGRRDTLTFRPLADIDVPVATLRARGIAFAPEQDDLDDYEIAYLSAGPGRDFAVMQYTNGPPDKASLLVSDELFHQGDDAAVVGIIAEALDLSPALFHWRSERGETAAAA
jgi:hypothetical protein